MPHTMQVVTEPCKLSTFNISEMTKSDAAFTVGPCPFSQAAWCFAKLDRQIRANKPASRAFGCIAS